MHNTMKYKTYIGSVEFDEEKEMFFGSVLGIRTPINYQGQDAGALVRDFHRAVDDYFAACAAAGTEPERAYKGTFNVRVSEDLHREAVLYGLRHDMSLNSVVEQALQHMVEEQLHQSALSAQENGERSMPHDEQRNQHGTHGDPREAATEPADQSFSLTDKAISALLNMGQVEEDPKQPQEDFTEEERQLMALINEQRSISQKELAARLGWTLARVKYYTQRLKERGILERQGSNQKGLWKVSEE